MALSHLIALCLLLWCADLVTCGDNPPDIRTSQGVMESMLSIDCRAGSHVTAGMSMDGFYGIELECRIPEIEKRVMIAKSTRKDQMKTNPNVTLPFSSMAFDALYNSDNASASFLTAFFIDWPIKSSVDWNDCDCVFNELSKHQRYNVTPNTVNYSKLVCNVSQEHAVELSIIRRTEKGDVDIFLTPHLSLPTTSNSLKTFPSRDGLVVYRVDNTSTISVLTAFVPNVQDRKLPYQCSITTPRERFDRPFSMTSHPITSHPATVPNPEALKNEKEDNISTLVAVAAVVSLLTLAVGFIVGYMLGKRQECHRLPINEVLTSVDSVLDLSSTNSDHTTSTLLSGTHSMTEQV